MFRTFSLASRRSRALFFAAGLSVFAAGTSRLLALNPDLTVNQYNCQNWRVANGLPSDTINAVAQSPDGYVWLGTAKGLVRFDGREFRVLDPSAGGAVNGKNIDALAGRSRGGLWFGLERGGFGYFDGQRFTAMDSDSLAEPSTMTVHVVQETRDGKLLLASNFGAARSAESKPTVRVAALTNTDVFCAYEDALGRVWTGTSDRGLFYLQNGHLTAFPDPTLFNEIIFAVAVDREGLIWVGTEKGLRCYSADFKSLAVPAEVPQTKTLLVDSHGAVWIGTLGNGLYRYYHGSYCHFDKQAGLANDLVGAIAETRDGCVWVGTADGLSQFSDVKFPIYSKTEGMVSETCLSVGASPAGGVWIGTGNGISRYSGGQFTNLGAQQNNGFRSSWIKSVFEARNGDVYIIAAQKNVDRITGGHVTATWTNGTWPRAIVEDARGVVIAFAGDLMRVENDQLVPYRLANGKAMAESWVNFMLVARDGSLWIACDLGVHQIKDGVLHDWSAEDKVKTRYFYLCEDDSGAVWAAQSRGVARFKNGPGQLISHEHGLHEDLVYAMVADNLGNFWVDSNQGIFSVSQREMNAVADGNATRVNCTVYQGQDAVKTTDKLSQDYSGCQSTDGRIWFPSSKGVIAIDPARVPANAPSSAVAIECVRIDGAELNPSAVPKIEPGPGNLEFDYFALDYLAPQKVHYRYRLEGFDSDWVDAGSRRSAFYTNLRPGHYDFHVQSCNADGVWNAGGANFAFDLPRRFFETIGFRAGASAALLGLIFYFWVTWHLRRKQIELERANAVMETKVRERTAELAAANGALRREIDERKRAQAETERLQMELIEASRQAGQAEVASSVLHNVGNVLNSVNVSTDLITNRLRRMRVGRVAEAARLMHDNTANLANFVTADERGRKLPVFLQELGQHLNTEQADVLIELGTLGQHVEHIKEIVAKQQAYARVGGILEKVELAELVETAIKLESRDGLRQAPVVRDFAAVRAVNVDRHKALQILINLLRNAQRACEESKKPDSQITVRIRPVGEDRVRVEIMDNGVGIAAENLTRIFSHGFTTRKNGHGFGLHSAALAAQQMGGSLAARSDGPGAGATFALELPTNPPKAPSES